MAQALESLALDLADSLARDTEVLGDFFERVFTIESDPEPHADDSLLVRRERLEHLGGALPDIVLLDGIYRRRDPVVLKQVAQDGFAVAADRNVERNRIAGDGFELFDLVSGRVQTLANLLIGGSAAESFSNSRKARANLFRLSFMWTGMRMVRDLSAIARVIACRIHQVA